MNLGWNKTRTDAFTNGVALSTNNFLYDGWNLIAETKPDNSLIRSYVWGTDLSGTSQGAGGVGGLLEMSYYGNATTNCFPAFDGNGNIMALVNAADGTVAANYDYGAFGEPIRITGVMARNNPFRFSTKYADDESDLLYYGYRYYKPSTGAWPNRDPIGLRGGKNIYSFARENPISNVDVNGLQIVFSPPSPIPPLKPKFPPACPNCCECAVDIGISDVENTKTGPGGMPHPGTFFNVNIYLEYHKGDKPGEATVKWEEKSNRPPKVFVDLGAKPNEWNDLMQPQFDPGGTDGFWPWLNRGNNFQDCSNPYGKIITIPDWPTFDPTLGDRVTEFRITVVNPPNCNCGKSSVSVTAIQTLKPGVDPSFVTPNRLLKNPNLQFFDHASH